MYVDLENLRGKVVFPASILQNRFVCSIDMCYYPPFIGVTVKAGCFSKYESSNSKSMGTSHLRERVLVLDCPNGVTGNRTLWGN